MTHNEHSEGRSVLISHSAAEQLKNSQNFAFPAMTIFHKLMNDDKNGSIWNWKNCSQLKVVKSEDVITGPGYGNPED